MDKHEGFNFIVDGISYDLKTVPDRCLAILKKQALDNLSIINGWNSKNKVIAKISKTLMYVGAGAFAVASRMSGTGFLVSTIIAGISFPLSLAGKVYCNKKNHKIIPQKYIFDKIHTTLSAELNERTEFRYIFPDCYNKELLKPVGYCLLDSEIEI